MKESTEQALTYGEMKHLNKVNLLLFRGSPRSNIEEVERWNAKLPCDKLLVRHTGEFLAYQIARAFFIKHTEYTHFVIATDDIIVKPSNIKILQKDLEEHDFPVLSGYMNVNQDDWQNMNLCVTLPSKARSGRKYVWMQEDDIPDEMFIEVAFSGFPLMAIRRDVIESYPVFAADKSMEGMAVNRGASLDLTFCWHCHGKYPITVDTGIKMRHLRKSGFTNVNKLDPITLHWKQDGTQEIL